MAEEAMTFKVEDAEIIWLNFAGREGQYNDEGQRNFSVVLDEESAERLGADGWNVKVREGKEEGDPDIIFIPVKVEYKKGRPPHIVVISSSGRTPLDEKAVEMLDFADIQTVDLICRGNPWSVNGKSGVKAYLKTMFITIREDELEQKYGISYG